MADEIKVPEGSGLDPEKRIGSFSTTEGSQNPDPDPNPAPAEGSQPPPQPAATPPPAPAEGAPANEGLESIIKKIREGANVDLKTEDEIINEIKSGRDLKTKLTDAETRISSLDPLAVDIDRAVKAGMDVDLYLETRKMDVAKMDDKEALRKQFMINNQGLVKSDPAFAEMKFEQEYRNKYPVLSEDMTEEEKVQRKSEIDFAERSRKFDAAQARENLETFKKKNVTIPDVKDTQEMSKNFVDQYNRGVEAFVGGIESVEIPVEGGESFKIGSDEFIGEIQNKLKNPVATLRDLIGVDLEKFTVDPGILGEVLLKLQVVDTIGPRMSKWLLEQQASREVTETLKTAPPQPPAGGSQLPQKSHEEKVADAIEAQREARRQGR